MEQHGVTERVFGFAGHSLYPLCLKATVLLLHIIAVNYWHKTDIVNLMDWSLLKLKMSSFTGIAKTNSL